MIEVLGGVIGRQTDTELEQKVIPQIPPRVHRRLPDQHILSIESTLRGLERRYGPMLCDGTSFPSQYPRLMTNAEIVRIGKKLSSFFRAYPFDYVYQLKIWNDQGRVNPNMEEYCCEFAASAKGIEAIA